MEADTHFFFLINQSEWLHKKQHWLETDPKTGDKSFSVISTSCEKCHPGCSSYSGDDCYAYEECNENHELKDENCLSLNFDECFILKHYEKKIPILQLKKYVSIEKTVFNNFISFGNGSTTVKDTEFKSCSLNGCGGTIY